MCWCAGVLHIHNVPLLGALDTMVVRKPMMRSALEQPGFSVTLLH